jgi:hypothetical protein
MAGWFNLPAGTTGFSLVLEERKTIETIES